MRVINFLIIMILFLNLSNASLHKHELFENFLSDTLENYFNLTDIENNNVITDSTNINSEEDDVHLTFEEIVNKKG